MPLILEDHFNKPVEFERATLADGSNAVLSPPPGTKRGRFWKGQPPFKKKGSLHRRARLFKFIDRLEKDFGMVTADPVEIMLCIANGHDPLAKIINEKLGERSPYAPGKDGLIDLELRLDACKAAAPYIHAKLNATQVTGDGAGLVFEARSAAMRELARDPAVRAAMETVEAKSAEIMSREAEDDGDTEEQLVE